MAATPSMESSSMETAAAVKSAKTRLPTERVASRDPAMRESTEGASVKCGHAVRHIWVSHLMLGKCTARISAVIEVRLTAREMIPIDDGCAVRDVGVVIVLNPAVMMPIEIPVMQSPAVARE